MFKVVKGNLGNFRTISLINTKLGIEVDIIQDFGAIINKYKVNHSPFSFIVGYKNEDELINQHPYFSRSAKLFPFPNRLKHGHYHYQQRQFTLPANFPWSEHAVHGLLYNQAFELVETLADTNLAQVQLRFQTPSLHSGFPFAVQVDVVYQIDRTGQLSCHTHITNQGLHAFPFGDAWHPYFSLGNELKDCTFTMAASLQLEHDDDFPTGTTRSSHQFNHGVSLQDANLNHCFQFADENKQTIEFKRIDQQAALHYQQDKSYPFVQLYTPQSEESLAIEPMTCPADAFNNHIGLLELMPTQTASFQWLCHAQYWP